MSERYQYVIESDHGRSYGTFEFEQDARDSLSDCRLDFPDDAPFTIYRREVGEWERFA